MRWRVRWMFPALVLFVFAAGCASEPKRPDVVRPGDYTYTKEHAAWRIRREMKKRGIPGLSIALVDDQRVVWAEGFGYADRARRVAATAETVYRVGSISKLFTATAAMRLAEEGKLDIDRPLRDFLPGFSIRSRFPAGRPITLRDLMTHHSGIPSDRMKGMWTRHPEPFSRLVRLMRDEYVAQPPGAVFSYSNVGVTLLGCAIERAAGREFASYLDESLLRPLGMTRSSFTEGPGRSDRDARAYRGEREAEAPSLRDVPAGGLNSNVLDLARFMEMVLAGGKSGGRQIVRPQTVSEMLRPQNADVPLDLDFHVGLGWMLGGLGDIDLRNAGTVAHHGGATLYHRSQLILLPDRKLGVVVLANSSTAKPAVDRIAAETIALALEAKTGIVRPTGKGTSETDRVANPEIAREVEGEYATTAGWVSIRRTPDGLRAYALDRSFRLEPRAGGLLGIRYKWLGIFPVSLGGLDRVGLGFVRVEGRDIVKAVVDGRAMLLGERIRPVPIPGAWKKRLGAYEIVNPGEDWLLFDSLRLREERGILLADIHAPLFYGKTVSFPVAPRSDDEALIRGLGRGMGETLRVVSLSGQEGILYSGYLLRKKRER